MNKKIKAIKLLKPVVVDCTMYGAGYEIRPVSDNPPYVATLVDSEMDNVFISRLLLDQWLEDGRVEVEYFEDGEELPEVCLLSDGDGWYLEMNHKHHDDFNDERFADKDEANAFKLFVEKSLESIKHAHDNGISISKHNEAIEAYAKYIKQYLTPTAE